MRLALVCLLISAGLSAQNDYAAKELRSAIQLEIGYYADHSSTELNLHELSVIADGQVDTNDAEPTKPNGSTTNISAPYFTLTFEKPFSSKSRFLWAAGINFLKRNAASGSYSVGSINHFRTTNLQGDSVTAYNRETTFYHANMYVRQLSLPIGVRYRFKFKALDWLQIGLNIAPGVTFTHRMHHSGFTSFFHVTKPNGSPPPADSSYTLIFTTPASKYHRLEGRFFTCYAGIPLQTTFNLCSRLHFLLSFEPGYTYLILDEGISQGRVMSRLGLGLKYSL